MRVVWTSAALRHLAEIQDHVARDSPAAAYRLASAITERTDAGLGGSPMMGRVGRARGTRELILRDLSYIVVYRVMDRVEVLAVVHTARGWPGRFD